MVDAYILNLAKQRPSHYLGAGVVDSLKERITSENIALLILDTRISPGQQRNLEEDLNCKVIDRTGLILEIFGARAQTHEGKLQVELAALEYQRSRLVRSWTHLERQRGGFGFLGGPGESQLEIDRRLITTRMTRLKRDLEQVKKTRGIQRAARRKVPFPIVALVGYTNAGKSTLFNTLGKADVLAKDMLFATLDPSWRALVLPNKQKVIVSDTVGFIAHLPTSLVSAFRATLEEVLAADIILHVRDMAHPEAEQQRDDVLHVLSDIGLDETTKNTRLIEVWNKIDLLPAGRQRIMRSAAKRQGNACCVSALKGEGLDVLAHMIEDMQHRDAVTVRIRIANGDGAALAWVHQHAKVISQKIGTKNTHITARLPAAELARLRHLYADVQVDEKNMAS